MKNVRIFNEDCLKGMTRIKSGVIDLILTDLPYGTTDASFDKKISLHDMWQQFSRITKENAANTKRKFIGFELDTNYFLKSKERLKANCLTLETVVASEVGHYNLPPKYMFLSQLLIL